MPGRLVSPNPLTMANLHRLSMTGNLQPSGLVQRKWIGYSLRGRITSSIYHALSWNKCSISRRPTLITQTSHLAWRSRRRSKSSNYNNEHKNHLNRICPFPSYPVPARRTSVYRTRCRVTLRSVSQLTFQVYPVTNRSRFMKR